MTNNSVLIIEDEKDICFLLGRVLTERNKAVTIANNLKDGMQRLVEIKPEILFLDIRLPDGSGLDQLQFIRQENPLMKIIMMSAYDEPQDRKKAMESGANHFIGKPLTNESIQKSLEIIEGQ